MARWFSFLFGAQWGVLTVNRHETWPVLMFMNLTAFLKGELTRPCEHQSVTATHVRWVNEGLSKKWTH